MSRRRRRVSNNESRVASKALKWVKRVLLGGLVLIVAVVAFGYMWVRSYMRSDEFSQTVSKELGNVLKVEGELENLRWTSTGASSDRFEARGTQIIHQLSADRLDVDIDWSSVWGEALELDTLSVDSLDLNMGTKVKRGVTTSGRNTNKKKKKKKAWFHKYIPSRAQLSGVDVRRLDLAYMTPEGIKYSLNESVGKLTFDPNGYSLELDGGNVIIPNKWIDSARLGFSKLNYRDDTLFVHSCSAEVFDSAELELTGEKSFASGGTSEFQGTLIGAECSDFLTEDWGQKLQGELATKFNVRNSTSSPSVIEGRLKVRKGVLTALPVLDKIAAYTNSTQFRHLRFSEFQCRYRHSLEHLELSEITLHCDGLMRIEGKLSIHGRKLDGDLQIGITPGTLSHIPGAETKIFLKGKNQMLWTPVKVSGTIDNMKEDLSERMLIAAGMRMFEMVPETGLQVLKYTGESIQTLDLPEGFGEVPNTVIEASSKLLGSGVESLVPSSRLIESGSDILGGILGGALPRQRQSGEESQEEKKWREDE